MSIAYSVDTSSLIAAWDERYPRDVFPTFWSRFSALVDEGRAACIDEVREELKKKNDELLAWTKSNGNIFLPLSEDVQRETSAILADPVFCRLTDSVKGRSKADPFVIAFAKVHGATVITEEKAAPRRIKIPDVCRALDIPCAGLVELIRSEMWSF